MIPGGEPSASHATRWQMAASKAPKKPGPKAPQTEQPRAGHMPPAEWKICPLSKGEVRKGTHNKNEPWMELLELGCSSHCTSTQQSRCIPCSYSNQARLPGPTDPKLPLAPNAVLQSAFTTIKCNRSHQPLQMLQTHMRKCQQLVISPANQCSVVDLSTKIDGKL